MVYSTTISAYAQPCDTNSFPLNGNVSIHSILSPKALTIGGNINCPDPAIRLTYQFDVNNSSGHLALLNDSNKAFYSQLPVLTIGDLILQADATANDIILTTRSDSGHIRFSTTELLNGPDIERMTITPSGKIGIWNNEPDNIFSVRTPIGIDYYEGDEGFQDLRFNCYQMEGTSKDVGKIDSLEKKDGLKEPSSSGYVNIQPGFSGIIQTRNTSGWGSMLLAVTKSNTSPDTDIDFFQHSNIGGDMPKGIMILNYLDVNNDDYATTGIGAMPNPMSRLTIQAFNDNSSMNIFHLVNFSGENMMRIRNDGLVVIGTKTFFPDTDPADLEEDMLLSVNGAIVAKEILVEITESKWADFVFDDDYDLPSLKEVESFIEKNNRLPDIPTAEEIKAKGLNIGKMQSKLLQKIEELTLYMIQLQNENEELKNRLNSLENNR